MPDEAPPKPVKKTSGYARGIATIHLHCCPCGKQAVAWKWGYVCADCKRIEALLENGRHVATSGGLNKPVPWNTDSYNVHIKT